MKLLLWVPPWSAHGDLNFYKNAVQNHLIPQGNILSEEGWDVTLFLPSNLDILRSFACKNIKIINFNINDQINCFGSLNDLSIEFYKQKDNVKKKIENISSTLSNYLDDHYDVILLWETPVPFLEKMFPDALIVNQMPGVFSRPPYPHFITFDINGLYKSSTLSIYSEDIKKCNFQENEISLANLFIDRSKYEINTLTPFKRKDLDPTEKYEKLILLPLQVSAHYSFQSDTPYSNQMEFLLDVLKDSDEKTGIVVTQYITPRVADTILTNDVVSSLKAKWPNLIYYPIFDKISSISQFLLPLVDEVVTCSSSLGLQGISWGRQLKVYGNTYLTPYSNNSSPLHYQTLRKESLNILSFILTRNQPLAHSVIKDGKFLSRLLKELLNVKRSGINNIYDLPSFLSIDEKYEDKLFNSFRTERVIKDLSQINKPISNKINELKRFSKFVNDSAIKIISFDIFDTLVYRPTEVPIDVFKFLETKMLHISNGVAENFSRIRHVSEVEARNEKDSKEVTLDEIYDKIKEFYKLDRETINNMKWAEVEYETKIIKPRPAGKKLWDIAKKTGKPIYIISDMYLPKDAILNILKINGYDGFEKVYISNEYGVSKKEGGLFDLVINESGVSPDNILHIGDNNISDNKEPKSRGIKTYRLIRSIDRLRSSEVYSKIYPEKIGNNELSRSLLAGLTAQKIFDSESDPGAKKSHFYGDPVNLGYAGIGPFVSAFMLWLGRKAKQDNISHLYFLSREGWLLKQVYDVIHKDDKDVPSTTYLYASRRATRVASLRTLSDVISLSSHPYQGNITVGTLLEDRFGINVTKITQEQWEEAGFIGPEDKLTTDFVERKKLSNLCTIISDIILTHAKNERKSYLNYVNSTGLSTEKKPAIVDIGWRANMQGALSSLINKPLDGYYYATLQGTEIWFDKGLKCNGFMGDLLSANHPSYVVQNRPLIEYLICHTEPSLITISDDDGFKPIFRPESSIGHRRILLELVHQGAIQFATDMMNNFRDSIDQIWIDPFLAERTLSSFLQTPDFADAQLFIGHTFEDALAGVKRKYIISPTDKDFSKDSVWRQGAAVLYSKKAVANKSSKPSPQLKESVKTPTNITSKETIKYNWKRAVEAKIIKSLVSQEKFLKYENNRDDFFKDSKYKIIKKMASWK
ncbi:HAD family hydrolase [Escherichia coli]|uniref:HAD family hydrolase n=1 Tax=Escherichia coli TaxID=562 RepID=UPI003F9F2E0F